MNKKSVLASMIMLALLNGCGSKDASEHYADAQKYIEQEKLNAAIIELKSAIQQAPQVGEYREALGLLYLQVGDSLTAEKELARAIEYSANKEALILPWIRSLYLSAQFEKILSFDSDTLSADTLHYVAAYKALSELELGDSDAAMAGFDKLSNIEDANLVSFAQANLAVRSKQLDTAIELLSSVAVNNTIYPEALLLRASIEMSRNNDEQAISLFEEYLNIAPRSLRAMLLLSQTQVKAKQFDAAEKNIQTLLKALPEQPVANYLKAMIELEKRDFVLAKEHAEKAISNGYNAAQVRIIAAIASTQQNLDSQALNHLTAVKNQLHFYPPAQKLYTLLQLRAGETQEAQAMLLNMDDPQQDLKLVAATSFELVKQGNSGAARELLSKYEQQFNVDAQSLTTMGVVKLDIPGQELAAIRDLEQALLLDPTSDKTKLVLAGSYLRVKQYDKAKQIADELIKNQATAATGYNLNAFIALQQQNVELAKEQLTKAEAIQADNPFTLLLLAAIAADEQDYAKASVLLETCIAKYPQYRPALKQYYYVKRLQNEGSVAVKKAEELLEQFSNNNELRSQLAQFYYAEKNYQQAAALLTDIVKQNVTMPSQDWMLLINSTFLTGDKATAQELAAQWHSKYPDDVYALVTHARALAQQQDMQGALKVLNGAAQEQRSHRAVLTMKMLVMSELKQYKEALSLIDTIPEDIKQSAEMLVHKGRLLQLNGQMTPALNTFLQSYEQQPSALTTMLIANVYATDRSHKQAVQFLEKHFSKHDAEPGLKMYYANLLMDVDNSKAQQVYVDLLKDTPDNVAMLNNYAWLLNEAEQPEKAQEFAEKALKQAPDNPDVLDTYGKIVLQLAQYSDAIGYFEKSLKIRPANTGVQLNYAEALIKSGDKAKAKSVLMSIQSEQQQELSRRNELLSMTQN